MKLAVIADTAHHVDSQGRLCALAPVVFQLERLGGLFDAVLMCAPLYSGPPPPSFSPYTMTVELVPLRPGGGATAIAKSRLLVRVVEWWIASREVARRVDALHFRCPSNVAAVGLIATLRMRRHKYTMYAGSWSGYEGEPLTYRIQRWLLRRRSIAGFATVYGRRQEDPPHVVDFYSPSFDDATWASHADAVRAKVNRLKRTEQLQAIRIASVGALNANKGHDVVIEAVGQLRREGLDATLDVIGGGPDAPSLKRRAAELGLEHAVGFSDYAPMARVQAGLLAADVAVVASKTEGYPKAAVEAMVFGAVPVLAPFATANEMVGDGDRGMVAERTSAGIARSIGTISRDPPRMAAMIVRGREYTKQRTLDAFERDLAALTSRFWRRSGPRPLRVMQVVDTLATGGRERVVVDLANELVGRGMESHVCETRCGGSLATELDPAVTRLVLNRSRTWDLAAMVRLARYVRRQEIDVLHTHGRAVTQFVALIKTSFRVDVRQVFHDHLPGVDETTRAEIGLHAAARLSIDGVIGVSDDLAAWATQRLGLPSSRVWSVMNGIRVERFVDADASDLHAEFGIPRSQTVLVALGNVRPQKDYETLLRAFGRLESNTTLLIVGSEGEPPTEYARCCRSLVRELALEDRVVFAGARSDVPQILAAADIGVLTSRYESGPLAVAEFAAAGLPFVATATGPITMLMADRPFAAVLPSGAIAEIAGALERMVALPRAARMTLGDLSRRVAAQSFTLERMVDAVEEIYDTVSRQS